MIKSRSDCSLIRAEEIYVKDIETIKSYSSDKRSEYALQISNFFLVTGHQLTEAAIGSEIPKEVDISESEHSNIRN